MTDALVSVRGLSKVYEPSPLWLRFLLRTAIHEPVTALRGISLDVSPGTVCAVVGPNGAGKSTLFRVLTGLTTPTQGSAQIDGIDVTHRSVEVRRLIGFMPAEERTLFLRHSCRENLRFHGQLQGMEPRHLTKRVADVLEMVGLTHAIDKAGFALSSGMRARLMLARALLHHPRVLILDEPTGAVDPVASHELLQLVEGVAHEEKVAVLLSSHRLEEIEALRDRAILLDKGQIVYDGNLEVLQRVYERPRIDLTFDDVPAANHFARQVGPMSNVDLLQVDGPTLSVTTDLPTGSLLIQLDGCLPSLVSVSASKLPLRDLLSQIYAQSSATGRHAAVSAESW